MALNPVLVGAKSIESYRPIVGDDMLDEIKILGDKLKGARVLHVNATDFGGGVAEILFTLVPLMRDVGIDAHWEVINGSEDFFTVTKFIHNGLQGGEIPWTESMEDIYKHYNQLNAELMDLDYDYYVIHDPQPLLMYDFLSKINGNGNGKLKGKWIWRCHIDPSSSYKPLWNFLKDYIEKYDVNIFTLPEYTNNVQTKQVEIFPPCIDPLSPKNADMDVEAAKSIVRNLGINTEKPLITQVSRYDPWKDPIGVIKAYKIVKKEIPDLQLALVGSMAKDDPEGWHFYEKTARAAGEDYDIFILSDLQGVGNAEVNAFQKVSDVVIQKSLREGFGLVAAEALWKKSPVVAGNVGGLRVQVVNGKSGYLVDSYEECAERVLELLQNSQLCHDMGEWGYEHVRKNFLTTRNLRDYLRLFASLT